MGILRGICISEQRGTAKRSVPEAELRAAWGIVGDAHAGSWHRQVSLLSQEQLSAFWPRSGSLAYGSFGENLIVEGLELSALPVGSRVRIGGVLLETTQIGKVCHTRCAIYDRVGDCIMSDRGVFAAVLESGRICIGDPVELLPLDPDRPLRAAVITLSDRGWRGERADESGPEAARLLAESGYAVVETLLLPDDESRLREELIRLADSRQVELILTTGGTGFSERDRTPEATLSVATRNAPGIAEAIRSGSLAITRRAMLSRAVSVIRGRTLIVNLPGSPAAVRESLDIILGEIAHGLRILTDRDGECATTGQKGTENHADTDI